MTSQLSLVNEPLGLFLDLAQASYKGPIKDCLNEIKPESHAKHLFQALDRVEVEGYPMYLIRYTDSVGQKHLGVSVKGLFGEENNFTVSNATQSLGAVIYHVLDNDPIFQRSVIKVIDAWQQTHGKIDSAVSHSAGCRITSIVHEYLKSQKQPITCVTFNGQRPTIGPGIFNVRTSNDSLTTDNPGGSFLYGNPVHSIGEGGHGLDCFRVKEHLTLREFEEEQRGVLLLNTVNEGAQNLCKKFDENVQPTSEDLNETEQFIEQLKQLQENETRKLENQELIVLVAKVGSAVANGFEQWQKERTKNLVLESAQKMQQDQWSNKQEHLENQRTWNSSTKLHSSVFAHLNTARWVNNRLLSNPGELTRHLTSLKKHIKAWEQIQIRSNDNNSRIQNERSSLLQKEITHEKKMIGQILGGLSSTCNVAAAGTSFFCPPAAAALGCAGSVLSAGSSVCEGQQTQKNIDKQEEIARIQHQASLFQIRATQAEERKQIHEQALLGTFDQIIHNENVPPWIRRTILEDRIAYWDQKLQENKDPETEKIRQEVRSKLQDLKKIKNENTKKIKTQQLMKEFSKAGADSSYLAWFENEQQLAKALQADEELLQCEQKVAFIKDRGWEIAEYWSNVWLPSDKDTLVFANALNEQIDRYFEATEEERRSILCTFSAFEQLGAITGSRHLKRGAQIGKNLYSIADFARFWDSTAFPNLKAAWKEPGSVIENLGGLPKLLSGYLYPALQFLSAGMQIWHLVTEGPVPPSKAEVRSRQLQYLSQQLNQLKDSVSEVAEKLTSQDLALQNGFEDTLHAIRDLHSDIEKKIQECATATDTKLDTQKYNEITAKRKDTVAHIEKELEIFKGKRKNPKSLENFSAQLLGATSQCMTDIESGSIQPDNGDQVILPEYYHLIYRNPGHHTGLLLSLIKGKNLSLPNLQQYLQIVTSYQYAVEVQAQLGEKSNQINENLQSVHNRLLAQGRKLGEFIELFNEACDHAADAQKTLIEKLNIRLKQTLETEETDRIARVKKIATQLKDEILKNHAGESRFGLTSIFAHRAKPNLAIPPIDAVLQQANKKYPKYKDITIASMVGGVTLGGTGGAITGGPIGIPIGMGVGTVGGGLFGIIAASFVNINKYISKQHDFVTTMKSKEYSGTFSANLEEEHQGIWYVGTARRIHNIFITRIDYRVSWRCFYKEIYKPNLNGRVFPIFYTQFSWVSTEEKLVPDYYRVSGPTLTVPNLISRAEMDSIPSLNIKLGYKNLLINYLEAIETTQPKGEFEEFFFENSVIIPSIQSDLSPLAFPKSLFELINHEERKLAMQNLQLSPYYSFVKKEDLFELALEFFVDTQKHSSIVVATFDEQTVRAFGAPIITDQGLSQEEPNINEFLITAMYASSFHDDVGFPGKQTVSLREGELLAPVDVAFSGVYKLFEKEISQMTLRKIQFDSTSYDGDDDVFGSKLALKKDFPRLEGNDSLEEDYQEYCLQYQILKAMCSLQLNLKHEEIDSTLSSAGLILNTRGKMDDIYSQIATTPQISDSIYYSLDQPLKSLQITYPFSHEQTGLIGALAYLESPASADF